MANEARPYLVPDQATLRHQPWRYRLEEQWLALPAELTQWDGSSDIALRTSISVDMAQLHEHTGLPPATPVVVGVSWRSSTSGMVDAAPAQALPGSGDLLLETTLNGGRIGGSLRIRTSVALGAVHPGPRPGVAHRPGSVLLESFQTVLLEAPTSMFPVHDLDFAAVPGLDDQASWHLEISGDLDSPFHGTCRLLLNTRDGELLSAVRRQRKDARQEVLVEELMHAVAQLLLETAAHHRATLRERGTWPQGSVGEVLATYLTRSDRHLAITAPRDSEGIAVFRTQLAGGARALGYGRALI